MAHIDTRPITRELSEIAVNGAIVDLHIIQAESSGQRLVVGGADDGSVILWSLE